MHIICLRLALLVLSSVFAGTAMAETPWKNPLVKLGYTGSPLVETTPFVFHDRLYLMENYQAFMDTADKVLGADSEHDACRIRDVETGGLVAHRAKEALVRDLDRLAGPGLSSPRSTSTASPGGRADQSA